LYKGLVHVYYGDGPGKTTAATGLAARAKGCGGSVLFAQFLKNGRSGELAALRKLSVEILDCEPCEKFFFIMDEKEKERTVAEQRGAFLRMAEAARSGKYSLLVLDEVLDVVKLGIVSPGELLEFLRNRPESLEAALTGHEVFPELMELADYVTEVKKVKHPYDRGVKARRGVEW
jgi:cob(I)alamin adenosyltransferase